MRLLQKVLVICLFTFIFYPCQLMLAENLSSTPASSASSNASDPDFLSRQVIFPFDEAPSASSSSEPLAALSSLGLSNPSYDWGPVTVGGKYDTLFGTIVNARYAQALTPHWAMGLLGEYGTKQARFNGTLGRTLWEDGQVKFTGEYLSQVLPFEFDSGDINQRLSQSAYGVVLQQNLHDSLFQNVNLGGYWSKAPNVGLSDVVFMQADGLYYTNQRNIAGATTQGLDVGTEIHLAQMTGLNAKVFYDNVHYNTVFTEEASENTFGAGGLLALEQVVNDRVKFDVKSEFRAIYNTCGASVSWAPAYTEPLGLQFSLFAERVISHNETPDSNSYGLSLSFLSDTPTSPHYALSSSGDLETLESWVKTPAVYMERVLAIAEQKTTLDAPMISSIEPDVGPLVGGNTVTIHGTNFLPGVTVTFNGVPGIVTIISSTELSVIVPALTFSGLQANGDSVTENVDVIVTNGDGQKTVFSAGYTYTTAFEPELTSVSPETGPLGGDQTVTLTGTQLTGTTSVTFGETPATQITVVDDSTVTVSTPEHAVGTVSITLTSAGGSTVLTNAYTYAGEPTITNISPATGSVDGGTSVTITGTNLLSTSSITFGGESGTNISAASDAQVTVTTPPHGEGAVDVVLTNANSAVTATEGYTYNAAPTIMSLSPSLGTSNGGTSVTLMGTNLLSTSSVTFGGIGATITQQSDTQVTVNTPSHASGTVDVVLTNAHDSVTVSDGYTYSGAPTIVTISPSAGSSGGGENVILTGTNFLSTSGVTFGGTAVTTVMIDSDTQVTVITPAHAAGAVNVVLTNITSAATATNGYTYNDAPSISSLSPAFGAEAGGNTVTISGANFTSDATVLFGTTPASSVTYNNDTSLTVTAPAGTGTVDVMVTTPGGTSAGSEYTYNAAPTLSDISPASGTTAGGSTVTLTGTNLLSTSSVTFGGVAGTNVTAVSNTEVTVTTPAHAEGTFDVVLTNASGSVTLIGYTYNGAPTITNISPASGTTTGDSTVTITGTNLTSTSGITFGGTVGTNITATSDTEVTVTVPAHVEGAVDVVLTNANTSVTVADGYTYNGAPTITDISPTSGSTAGGDTVTITGTNLISTTGITFDGIAGTNVTATSDTEVTVTTPAHAAGAVDVVLTNAHSAVTATDGYTYVALVCTTTVTSSLSITNPYAQPLAISYTMIGGGGGIGSVNASAGGGGSSALVVDGVTQDIANGGTGGSALNNGSNGTVAGGVLTLPVSTNLTAYVGGGGGGAGSAPGSGPAGGGASGYYGGGGGGTGSSSTGGGGGSNAGGAGGSTGGASGSSLVGGNGALSGGSGGAGNTGGSSGADGSGGGGGYGGGGGANRFGGSGGAGGTSGADGTSSAVVPGGLGANNWSSNTSLTLPSDAGLGGNSSRTGGNAGLIILQYTSPTSSCAF